MTRPARPGDEPQTADVSKNRNERNIRVAASLKIYW